MARIKWKTVVSFWHAARPGTSRKSLTPCLWRLSRRPSIPSSKARAHATKWSLTFSSFARVMKSQSILSCCHVVVYTPSKKNISKWIHLKQLLFCTQDAASRGSLSSVWMSFCALALGVYRYPPLKQTRKTWKKNASRKKRRAGHLLDHALTHSLQCVLLACEAASSHHHNLWEPCEHWQCQSVVYSKPGTSWNILEHVGTSWNVEK